MSVQLAADRRSIGRIGMLGTYPPRLCGLATFGAALAREFVVAGRDVCIIAVDDTGPTVAAGALAPCDSLRRGNLGSARRVAKTLSACDVAVVQHEFGIFGGADGDELLGVLRTIDAPVVVVLHTVPSQPSPHQRSVLEEVCSTATVVVVMSATAVQRLASLDVDLEKVQVIAHGAWSSGRTVRRPGAMVELLTWGLLGPGKGVEHMIAAMARLSDAEPHVKYTVAGVTHPNVLARDGDRYRRSLIQSAWALGVSPAVRFDDAYRDVRSLFGLVSSSSVVVLPYDSADQVTSGVLVDAIAAGVPVIATGFPHAIELLSDGAGIIVPHRDPAALAEAVRRITLDPPALARMTARAQAIAPSLAWGTVAAQYLSMFDRLSTGVAPVAG